MDDLTQWTTQHLRDQLEYEEWLLARSTEAGTTTAPFARRVDAIKTELARRGER